MTGNRNGVYINNVQNISVRNNVIDFNRTGMQVVNDITGAIIRNNFITNNWTLGVLFNFDSASLKTTGVTVTDNNISGNWYSQVECRWTNSTAILDVSGNWLGGSALVVRGIAECDRTGLLNPPIPAEYGGSATNPGGAGLRGRRHLQPASTTAPG